jgi:hypothetical protein
VFVQATRYFERDEEFFCKLSDRILVLTWVGVICCVGVMLPVKREAKQVQCEISINQCEFFNFGVNKFDPGVNPTNRWYEVDILMV